VVGAEVNICDRGVAGGADMVIVASSAGFESELLVYRLALWCTVDAFVQDERVELLFLTCCLLIVSGVEMWLSEVVKYEGPTTCCLRSLAPWQGSSCWRVGRVGRATTVTQDKRGVAEQKIFLAAIGSRSCRQCCLRKTHRQTRD
jgi:hypothetical protein